MTKRAFLYFKKKSVYKARLNSIDRHEEALHVKWLIKHNVLVDDRPKCHSCGANVDSDMVCAQCDEYVCEDCMVFGNAMECIEECRCKDCHDEMRYNYGQQF